MELNDGQVREEHGELMGSEGLWGKAEAGNGQWLRFFQLGYEYTITKISNKLFNAAKI